MIKVLKSSQEGVKLKLRVKAVIIALFPLVSALLRQFFQIELLELDWVYIAEWIAYGVASALELWGWIRARKSASTKN